MVKDYISVYESHTTNTEIAISGSQTFFSNEISRGNMLKWKQSFNSLEIINNSTTDLNVYLDGKQIGRKRLLYGKVAFQIKPEEQLYFNTLVIENTSGATVITAGDLTIIARIEVPEKLFIKGAS